MPQYRTHTCCELRKTDVDKEVTLSGWIHSRRDHGGVLFIDLRDNYGLTQVVIYPTRTFLDEVSRLPKETVIRFVGKVAFRSDENVNPKLPTGEIEVAADSYEASNSPASSPSATSLAAIAGSRRGRLTAFRMTFVMTLEPRREALAWSLRKGSRRARRSPTCP